MAGPDSSHGLLEGESFFPREGVFRPRSDCQDIRVSTLVSRVGVTPLVQRRVHLELDPLNAEHVAPLRFIGEGSPATIDPAASRPGRVRSPRRCSAARAKSSSFLPTFSLE